MHPIFRERRDRVVRLLSNRGWNIACPDMAMYLWMPLPAAALARGWSDEQTASELLQRSGVALTPGSGFGVAGRDWLRMALVAPTRILRWRYWMHLRVREGFQRSSVIPMVSTAALRLLEH